jgi:hypothetical protein
MVNKKSEGTRKTDCFAYCGARKVVSGKEASANDFFSIFH